MPIDPTQQEAIMELYKAGILKGYQGHIYPDHTLRRYEMALLIDRICKKYNLYTGLPILNPSYHPYDDTDLHDAELDQTLKTLQKYGIMK